MTTAGRVDQRPAKASARVGAPADEHSMRMRPGSGKALRRAMRYLRVYWPDALGALIATLLVNAANLAAPQLIRVTIDIGIAERDGRVIALAVGGTVAIAIVRSICSFFQGFLAERASQRVAFDLRNDLFTKLERLSFAYYDRTETGQLLTRATSDVEQIRSFVGTGLVNIISSVVLLISTAILLLILNWRLAIIVFLIVPPIFYVLGRFGRQVGPVFGFVQGTLGRLNSILQEDLTGLRTIRAFRGETRERQRYESTNEELYSHNLTVVRLFSGSFRTVFLIANLGTLGVVLIGGNQVIDGELQIGALIAFNAYVGFLLLPILTIGFLASMIPRAATSALRVFEVLDEPIDVQDRPDAKRLPTLSGKVEFRDVRFRYPGAENETLRGVNFTVESGQTVAVIGTTGSGKSTLVNLLPRFYDVTHGAVRLDDCDVRDVTLESLRGQIATVMQETRLFSGTVRDNIAYGRQDATQDEIIAAAEAAQAATFIHDLPQEYETVIGERGVGLSGGQRQRVAIARALLANRCLLILDDSTSAVDAATEADIREALDRLMRDQHRTVFVIAQRISTVRDANLILVMDRGQIVAQGTHDDLIQDSELYVDILGSQLERDDLPSHTREVSDPAEAAV